MKLVAGGQSCHQVIYWASKIFLCPLWQIWFYSIKLKQVWHWPYEAPGIVDSGLYAITIVCGPKDMSQEKYILIWQKL